MNDTIITGVKSKQKYKTNSFPREQTLSVLLYNDERKINNIHTTIVFRDKTEFKIETTYT
jgi:hypothetical protein